MFFLVFLIICLILLAAFILPDSYSRNKDDKNSVACNATQLKDLKSKNEAFQLGFQVVVKQLNDLENKIEMQHDAIICLTKPTLKNNKKTSSKKTKRAKS